MTYKRVKTINGKPHPDLFCLYKDGKPVCFIQEWELPECDYLNDDGIIYEAENNGKVE